MNGIMDYLDAMVISHFAIKNGPGINEIYQPKE